MARSRLLSARAVVSAPLLALAVAGLMAGCASANASGPGGENAGLPAWFVEREAKIAAEGQPDLAAVPSQPATPQTSVEFDRVEAELKALAKAVFSDPRAAPAPALGTAEQFDAQARADIDAARR